MLEPTVFIKELAALERQIAEIDSKLDSLEAKKQTPKRSRKYLELAIEWKDLKIRRAIMIASLFDTGVIVFKK